MKSKFFLLIITLFLFFFQSVGLVEARSGCCSHHGGVCGCGCCDGTSLSAKCAPYYPECSANGAPKVIEQRSKIVAPTRVLPTRIVPTKLPTRVPTAVPKCSSIADGYCPVKNCGAGNDPDCCNAQKNDYQWYQNWGCYPSKLNCSGVSDNKCDNYCSPGNDADCCNNQNNGYRWYENWGCYPK